MRRAKFSVELDGDDVVVITDHDASISVTNDAERVVQAIGANVSLTARRIVYRDTQGRWDGIAVRCGQFSHFVLLGLATRDLAVIAARNRPQW